MISKPFPVPRLPRALLCTFPPTCFSRLRRVPLSQRLQTSGHTCHRTGAAELDHRHAAHTAVRIGLPRGRDLTPQVSPWLRPVPQGCLSCAPFLWKGNVTPSPSSSDLMLPLSRLSADDLVSLSGIPGESNHLLGISPPLPRTQFIPLSGSRPILLVPFHPVGEGGVRLWR